MRATSKAPFDDERIRAGLKPIRNRMRKYYGWSLVRHVIDILSFVPADEEKLIVWMTQYQPWNMHKFLERTILWADFGLPPGPAATRKDFIKLHNRFNEFLNQHVRLPHQYDSLFSFGRTEAFKQFSLQLGPTDVDIGRQRQLLLLLPDNGRYFSDVIRRVTGVEVEEYFDIMAYLSSHFANPRAPPPLRDVDIRQISAAIPTPVITRFLAGVSRTILQIRADLEERYATASNEEQIFGSTPLWRTPFILDGTQYISVSRPLLWEMGRDYLYEILREEEQNFVAHFGRAFEKYLRLGLEYGKQSYWDEAKLKTLLTEDSSQVVDYAILADDAVILVEAKGVVMPPQRRGAATRLDVASALKTSMVKAVAQGLSVAGQLRKRGVVDGVDLSNKEYFLLIVSFRDLYIAGGKNFLDLYAEAPVRKFLDKHPGDSLPIAHDAIHPIDAATWDRLMSFVQSGDGTVANALRRQAVINREVSPLAFSTRFSDISKSYGHPPYLSETHMAVFDRIIERLAPKT